jgi:hypothetical protein
VKIRPIPFHMSFSISHFPLVVSEVSYARVPNEQ